MLFKKDFLLITVLLLTFFSCVKETKEVIKKGEVKNTNIKKVNSRIVKDSTLKFQKIDKIFLSSDKEKDTLIGFCNCEKNLKNNTLKIQIRTEFPSLSELRKGEKYHTEFQVGIPRQYRFITFYLKDSIVEKAKIFMASTELQFKNKKTDSLSFTNYELTLNKFNYKTAQNVWGNYKIELPSPFGFIENDTKVIGTFHCNNWKIVEYNNLSDWTIKSEY